MKNISKCALAIALMFVLSACQKKSQSPDATKKADTAATIVSASKNDTNLACTLTSEEMQQRETTVLASLKKQMTGKKELPNGYALKFAGTDKMIDELMSFIKTERGCCSFFTFKLSVTGDTSEVWLELTGPKEAKEFIATGFAL